MTATYPARTEKRYRGAVYGIDVLDHDTGQVVPDDYIGKTRQRGRLREIQHRDRQPFADRIVGDAHVLWEGLCTDEELAEAERHFIQDVPVRPRLNVEMNEDNPDRIPKWRQIEQRHERDRARNRTLWVPYEQRNRESLLEWNTPGRPVFDPAVRDRPARKLKPWEKAALVWLGTEVSTTLTVWLVLWQRHWATGVHALTLAALVLPAFLLLTSRIRAPRRKRRRTRRWSR